MVFLRCDAGSAEWNFYKEVIILKATPISVIAGSRHEVPARVIELDCPAGRLPALKAAVDNGADCIYIGFRDVANARNFAGLNSDDAAIEAGMAYAHGRGRKVFLALNTYPQPTNWQLWRNANDRAAAAGIDAVILADHDLMHYAAETWPALRLHSSVQGSATNHEAINFYHQRFGIARAVVPRVLLLAQVERLT